MVCSRENNITFLWPAAGQNHFSWEILNIFLNSGRQFIVSIPLSGEEISLLSRVSLQNMAGDWDFNQDIIIYSWQNNLILTRTESEGKESSVFNETLLKVLKYGDISLCSVAIKSIQKAAYRWSWLMKTVGNIHTF